MGSVVVVVMVVDAIAICRVEKWVVERGLC